METWKGSQAGRISGPVRSSHGCIALALSAPCALASTLERIGATRYEELARCYAVYVTFARCKCVAPHTISWSNGPRSRSSVFAQPRAMVLPALVPINAKRIGRLSGRRICFARSGGFWRGSEISKRANAREERTPRCAYAHVGISDATPRFCATTVKRLSAVKPGISSSSFARLHQCNCRLH